MNRNSSVAGLASLVQSRGRNGDTMLVHMTPGEVQGLQSLALAAGGSLSINPDTGLYEANFLKKLLPTLLGVGLNFLFPGLGALGSGLLVGAGETIRTGGDLGKGLMAGLGAFGGAGIGAGLSSAAKAGTEAALTGVTATGAAPGTEAFRQAAAQAAKTGAAETAKTAAAETAKRGIFSLNPDMGGTLQSYGQGLKGLSNKFGREAFMSAIPGGQAGAAAGVMGLANAFTPEMEMPEGYQVDDSYYQSYGYSPEQGRFLGGRFVKGYPGFPGYAGGGVIPQPNFNYPLSGPSQAVGAYEMPINPYTGEERFAEGGDVEPQIRPVRDMYNPDGEGSPVAPVASAAPRQADFDRALADYNKNLFSESMAILAMNPGMSFNKAQEFVTSRAQYNPAIAAGAPDPSMYGVAGASENIANVGDKSANFSWGSDLTYDPTIYANQFNWQKYIAANPDLAAAGIDTPWEAATHYSNYGKNENRGGVEFLNSRYGQPEEEFDPTSLEAKMARLEAMRESGQLPAQPAAPTPTPAPTPTTAQTPAPTPSPAGIGTNLPKTPFYQQVTTTPTAPTSYIPQAQAPSSYYQKPTDYFKTAPVPTPDQFPSLEEYYKTLMTAPQQPTPSSSFADYMQSLNKFATSPVAPPPAVGVNQQRDITVQPGTGGNTTGSGTSPVLGGMKWDPGQGKFVPGGGSVGDTGMNLDELQNLVNSGMFSGFNFGDLGAYLGTGGYGDTSGMQWNSSTGSFMQPGSQTTYTPPNMTNQFQYDPNQFSYGLGSFNAAPTVNPYQSSMSTGDYSSGMTTNPQYMYGNSDVLYGNDVLNLGQEDANIFGFSGGGSTEYAAAGKLLRGPGDGMSDDIHANIDGKQEARLADGEFVIPADVVSHLGNGSSEAGSRKLYTMMDRIRKDRTGREEQAPAVKSEKYLPA